MIGTKKSIDENQSRHRRSARYGNGRPIMP
jgi:hypothetical protein